MNNLWILCYFILVVYMYVHISYGSFCVWINSVIWEMGKIDSMKKYQ